MSLSYSKVTNLGFNLVYNLDLKIIICIECKTCLNSLNTIESIKKHLLYNKHGYNKKDINFKNLILELNKLEYNNLEYLKEIEPYKYYFKNLNLPINSYICTYNNCNFISINKKNLVKHFKIHNIENINNNNILEKYSKSNILVQSLFYKKYNPNYFIIKDNNNNNNNNNPKEISYSIVEDFNKELEAINTSYLIDSNNKDKREIETTIRKTNFYKFYNNKDLDLLLSLLESPNKNPSIEDKEKYIYSYFYKLLYKYTFSIENIINKYSRRILQNIKTENLDTSRKEMRDFSILTTNSKRKYYKSFNILIIYIFKFYKLSKNKEIKEENLI